MIPRIFYSVKSARQHFQIEHDAYARIVWGDSPGDIIRWLVNEKRLSYFQAKTLVGQLLEFRNADVRKSAIRHLWSGAIWFVIGFILCLGMIRLDAGRLFAFPFGAAAFGFLKITMGITRLTLPQLFRAHKEEEDALGDLEGWLSDNLDDYRLY